MLKTCTFGLINVVNDIRLREQDMIFMWKPFENYMQFFFHLKFEPPTTASLSLASLIRRRYMLTESLLFLSCGAPFEV